MPSEIKSYLMWKGSLTTDLFQPEIVEEKHSELTISDADTDVLFDEERKELSASEYADLKLLVLKSAHDFSSGALCLRMAVPLWAGTGSLAQNSRFPQEKAAAPAPYFKVWKISYSVSFRGPWLTVFVWRICESTGILQVYMSLRHIVWRAASVGCKRTAAQSGQRPVFMEIGNPAAYSGSLRESLSAFLPVSVPPGGNLWIVQQVQPGSDMLGGGKMRLLWSLRESLPRISFRP